ncbi:MAG: hypothetical protein MUQ00_12420 [Candidatus Aminicenantes bacterium]|nr:hypothetical protein [Candidatus Aminicenantes bacterium]
MRINEILRQQTLPARDRISGLDKQIVKVEAERNAAEERVKRASTEINRQRKLETDQKRALNVTEEKVLEAQRIFDDLERRRQEALETFMQCQEKYNTLYHLRRDAQKETEKALADILNEQKFRQQAEAEIARMHEERRTAEKDLRLVLLKSLDLHLEQQRALLQAAFTTQEQRSKVMRDFEAFRRARHTDMEIGRLCEERDEIRKLLNNAVVPGVKAILESSLKGIDEILANRFPGALQIPDQVSRDNQIEELLFYCDREGKAVCLLPIAAAEWRGEAASTECTANAMCLVWNMIREVGLRTEDGDFKEINDRSVFSSQLDIEDIASQGFSVKCEGIEVIRYVFAAVPTELQEAISHEDQND